MPVRSVEKQPFFFHLNNMPTAQESRVTGVSNTRIFTWDEVKKHNKLDDCWIVVHGKVYNVTPWVPKHPGGSIISNGAGREATALFISYHPLYVSSKLEDYLIGEVSPYHPYYTWDQSQFYTSVKRYSILLCMLLDSTSNRKHVNFHLEK